MEQKEDSVRLRYNMDFNNELLKYIKPEYNDVCKERMGTSFRVNESRTKIGFLVFGINPAGDEKDTVFEKQTNYFYLNYIDDFKNRKYISSVYFKPIYDLANRIFDDGAKWDWCNLDLEELNHFISTNDFSSEEINAMQKHYTNHKNRPVTIYIGDLFYIHETSQNNTLKWIETSNISNYVKKCLDEHISLIKKAGVEKLIIYVNNAMASDLISKAFNIEKHKVLR